MLELAPMSFYVNLFLFKKEIYLKHIIYNIKISKKEFVLSNIYIYFRIIRFD